MMISRSFGVVKDAGDELLADAAGEHHRGRGLDFAAVDADNF